MKKFLLLMAVTLTLGLTTRAADGDEFTVDNLKYKVLSEEGKSASLVGYDVAPTGDLIISQIVKTESSGYIVTAIGEQAFYKCSNLTSVTIPNSVTAIGEKAFNWCSNLTSVTLPNSVTEIAYGTFIDCRGLTSVTIPNSVTKIGDYAFTRCSKLTSITIPNSVTEIGEFAFSNCHGLTSVTIPNSVKKIGVGVFYNCSKLTEILVEEGNSQYTSVEGTLFNKDKTTLVQYLVGSKASDYEIPNSVTYINMYAFAGCKSLTSVTIPSSVTSISQHAFSDCSALSSVYCYALNPPGIATNAFIGLDTTHMILHVVKGSEAAYQEAGVWKDFFILGNLEPQAGIEGIEADGSGAPAEFFNLNGVRVNGEALTPGLYIKRQGGKATKVLVK